MRLRRLTTGLSASVLVKVEYLNPGGSVKDRAATAMVLAAERDGTLTGRGTIVEASSGNTGIGLAQAAAVRGHRIVVVLPDTVATEKVDMLRAYGADVIQTPANLPREHPDHVNNIARRIAEQTPGGWFANQYDNPANPEIHYATTGPEIWAATEGRVTHLVAGIGTGGTISGTGRYLKEQGHVEVVGADPATSRYHGGDGSPYFVEAAGHYRHTDTVDDTWPLSYHQDVVDRIEAIDDRDSVLTTRRRPSTKGCSSARRRRWPSRPRCAWRRGSDPSTPWWRSCPTPGAPTCPSTTRRTGCGAWASSTTTGMDCSPT